jgi:hypothetical protein
MAPDSEQQRLWIRALEDAGLDATAAVLVITTTPPSTRSGAAAGWFAPRATLQSPPLPLTDSEQSELADVGERHRVAVFGDAKPEIQLGMMRWCLEHVTQFDMNEQIPEFVGAINEACTARRRVPEAPSSGTRSRVWTMQILPRDISSRESSGRNSASSTERMACSSAMTDLKAIVRHSLVGWSYLQPFSPRSSTTRCCPGSIHRLFSGGRRCSTTTTSPTSESRASTTRPLMTPSKN